MPPLNLKCDLVTAFGFYTLIYILCNNKKTLRIQYSKGLQSVSLFYYMVFTIFSFERLFLFRLRGYDSRRLVMVTSSREGTMMPLVIPLAMA